MEKNNLLNILKTLTELMHCPTCGRAYTLDEVQYISQVDGYCLLQVSCKNCQVPVWVNFFIEKDQKKNQIERMIKCSLNEADISCDEVIEFHRHIRSFDGNFKKAFKNESN